MRELCTGLWMYRDHLIMKVAPDAFNVYWRGQHGWELWDHYSTLKRVQAAIDCVSPVTRSKERASAQQHESTPVARGG